MFYLFTDPFGFTSVSYLAFSSYVSFLFLKLRLQGGMFLVF